MFTYQNQPRFFSFEENCTVKFPNKVKILIHFQSNSSFGTENGTGKFFFKDNEKVFLYDANLGKVTVKVDPPPEPLEVNIRLEESKDNDPDTFKLKGNILECNYYCESLNEVEDLINVFAYGYPTLLNILFPEPPVVERISGEIGEEKFNYLFQQSKGYSVCVTKELLEENVIDTFDNLSLFAGLKNRRYLVASQYFLRAKRLNECGKTYWEFMPEIILNFYKLLEVLFVESNNSRDDIYKGLLELGYGDYEINKTFIPVVLLRSHLDVAHSKTSMFEIDHLKIIFDYLSTLESSFNDLLKNILDKIKKNKYKVREVHSIEPVSDDKKGIEKLIEMLDFKEKKTSVQE